MTLYAHKWLLLNVFFHSVHVLPWVPCCFSLSDWYWVLRSACWIILFFLDLSGIKIWQPLLPEEFLFYLKSLHTMTQGREKGLLLIPTLQTREARLHRIHSKAGNWTQISRIPRVSYVHDYPINPEGRTGCHEPLTSLTSAIAIFSLPQGKWVQERSGWA